MKKYLLVLGDSVVGIRLKIRSSYYDLGLDRLSFYFSEQRDLAKFISNFSLGDRLPLKHINGVYVTREEETGEHRSVLEVTDDVTSCNILSMITKHGFDFDTPSKLFKYKPNQYPQLDRGTRLRVDDFNFDIGKAIVTSQNFIEYVVGLNELE